MINKRIIANYVGNNIVRIEEIISYKHKKEASEKILSTSFIAHKGFVVKKGDTSTLQEFNKKMILFSEYNKESSGADCEIGIDLYTVIDGKEIQLNNTIV